MFSSIRFLMFGRSFISISRYCSKCDPIVLGSICNIRLNLREIKHNQNRCFSHLPRAVANSDASDSDREKATGLDGDGTRKKPPQVKLIYEVLKSGQCLSEEELIKFRENVLSAGNNINESNVDAVLIGMCSSLKNVEFADSYMHFLEQRPSEINLATMGRYMKLCYTCQVVDENKVLTIWNKLRERLPLMDASTAENVIQGLSITSEWKQGLQLMSVVKETCIPSASAYSSLAVAAFRNRDIQVGWNLMEECIKEEKVPLDRVYHVWLDKYCTIGEGSTADQCVEMAEKLLNFLSYHELLVSKEVSQKLKHTFEKMKWQCRYTSINERGACNTCKGEMHPIFVSKTEFQVLSQTFLEKVLVGPDVFSKSTPKEVKAFQELIAKEAPFNTVIDGLNVAYSTGVESRGLARGFTTHAAAILQNVVAHFVDLSHKILVLGRTHMNTWPRKEMDYIRKNSQLFLAENISQDDPFLLYAAMSSGPGTCFLSRDLMRSHAYRLKCAEPSLASVFQRWQMSHQMRLLGVSQYNRINIKLPMEYSPTVQKVDGRWHIPCREEEGGGSVYANDDAPKDGKPPIVPRSHLDPPTTWLCLSPRRIGEKSFRRFDNNRKFDDNRNFYDNKNFFVERNRKYGDD